jgi:hypothetical protein
MQRSWPKPLAAMSWSWLPHLEDATVARATMAGERSWANPAPMHLPNKANDSYRAARRSTRRR